MDPKRDPIVTASFCLYDLSLCINISGMSENIFFIGGFDLFLGLFNQSIINSIVSLSGTFANSDTTLKLTVVCFLLKLHFLTSFIKCSVDLSKYESGIEG